MTSSRVRALGPFFPALAALCGLTASADSISDASQNKVPAADAAAIEMPDADYHLFSGTGYTSPLDNPLVASLGLAPGSFLFGPNTLYDYTGLQRLSILSIVGDPTLATIALQDPNTNLYDIVFPDAGGEGHSGTVAGTSVASPTPEPKAAWLLGVGLIAMWGWASLRVRKLRAVPTPHERSIQQKKLVDR
jgi:hypothetical protein